MHNISVYHLLQSVAKIRKKKMEPKRNSLEPSKANYTGLTQCILFKRQCKIVCNSIQTGSNKVGGGWGLMELA